MTKITTKVVHMTLYLVTYHIHYIMYMKPYDKHKNLVFCLKWHCCTMFVHTTLILYSVEAYVYSEHYINSIISIVFFYRSACGQKCIFEVSVSLTGQMQHTTYLHKSSSITHPHFIYCQLYYPVLCCVLTIRNATRF